MTLIAPECLELLKAAFDAAHKPTTATWPKIEPLPPSDGMYTFPNPPRLPLWLREWRDERVMQIHERGKLKP